MNKIHRKLVGFVVLLSLVVATFSCTKVDNTFGDSFIPEDQRMKVSQDTLYGINAYLAQIDSFPLSYNFYGFIGSVKDATFGTTRASWLTQYAPISFSTEEENFGTAAVPDSLMLTLTISNSYFGDTTKTQKFNIYELKKTLIYDTLYSSVMDPAEYVDFEQGPLFTFENTGARSVRKRLTGPRVEALMKSLVDELPLYIEPEKFIQKFKGLYITPAADSEVDAATFAFSLANSSLMLVAHNYTDASATKIKDTVRVTYGFSPTTSAISSVSLYEHDYSGTPINLASVNDTLPTSTPVSLGYVQGAGGITTYLRFMNDFIASLKALITPPFTTMVINRATIEMGIDNPQPEVLDVACSRVGMYVDYQRFEPSADYIYKEESGNYPITLPYGGYLNRSRNSYKMDITRMTQIMLTKDPETLKSGYTILLAPSYNELYGQADVVLKTGNQPTDPAPLRVAVTYTLMR